MIYPLRMKESQRKGQNYSVPVNYLKILINLSRAGPAKPRLFKPGETPVASPPMAPSPSSSIPPRPKLFKPGEAKPGAAKPAAPPMAPVTQAAPALKPVAASPMAPQTPKIKPKVPQAPVAPTPITATPKATPGLKPVAAPPMAPSSSIPPKVAARSDSGAARPKLFKSGSEPAPAPASHP